VLFSQLEEKNFARLQHKRHPPPPKGWKRQKEQFSKTNLILPTIVGAICTRWSKQCSTWVTFAVRTTESEVYWSGHWGGSPSKICMRYLNYGQGSAVGKMGGTRFRTLRSTKVIIISSEAIAGIASLQYLSHKINNWGTSRCYQSFSIWQITRPWRKFSRTALSAINPLFQYFTTFFASVIKCMILG